MSNVLEAAFDPLIGLPCWNVKPGHGSFLTLEFGEPSLHIREPVEWHKGSEGIRRFLARRHVTVHGEWHLWIYCCAWEVYTGDELKGDSDLQGSTKERIQLAATELNGQKLVSISVDPTDGTSVFHFDLGSRLETRPYEPDSEQWILFEPGEYVWNYRSDGFYSHHPGDQPKAETEWLPLTETKPASQVRLASLLKEW